jgi:hypothetical protein
MQYENPGRIKILLKDSNKKNLLKIFKEVLELWLIKIELPCSILNISIKMTSKTIGITLVQKRFAESMPAKNCINWSLHPI